MKKTTCYAACIATTLLGCQIANAYDGKIEFVGKITAQTCTINGNGSNARDFTVTLPTVSKVALPSAGSVAGRTPFTIALTACSPASGTVATFFEPGPTVDVASGQLIIDAGGTNASNVRLGLLNDDSTPIQVGASYSASGTKPVAISAAGAANLTYAVQYVATGVTVEGDVKSRVQYTLVYN
ncbi:fimbrial protein [Pseudomonas putida]|uniref:fimbrial protein n=1 Tax=Pseudomonas putida TaxID=303 RepID=UPI00383B1635